MSRAWFAILGTAPDDADAWAPLHELDGTHAGFGGAWLRAAKPVRQARRIDPRLIDSEGAACLISLVWPDRERGLLKFDDLAVQQARRVLYRGAFPPDGVSTLLVDDSSFAGAVTIRRGPTALGRLRSADPFARIEPRRILTVGPGLFGAHPLPIGPVIERHGSAQPWPWERF